MTPEFITWNLYVLYGMVLTLFMWIPLLFSMLSLPIRLVWRCKSVDRLWVIQASEIRLKIHAESPMLLIIYIVGISILG